MNAIDIMLQIGEARNARDFAAAREQLAHAQDERPDINAQPKIRTGQWMQETHTHSFYDLVNSGYNLAA
jgi:hypothetical protein